MTIAIEPWRAATTVHICKETENKTMTPSGCEWQQRESRRQDGWPRLPFEK